MTSPIPSHPGISRRRSRLLHTPTYSCPTDSFHQPSGYGGMWLGGGALGDGDLGRGADDDHDNGLVWSATSAGTLESAHAGRGGGTPSTSSGLPRPFQTARLLLLQPRFEALFSFACYLVWGTRSLRNLRYLCTICPFHRLYMNPFNWTMKGLGPTPPTRGTHMNPNQL